MEAKDKAIFDAVEAGRQYVRNSPGHNMGPIPAARDTGLIPGTMPWRMFILGYRDAHGA